MITVGELREELIKLGLTEEQARDIKGKENLVAKIEELKDSPDLDLLSLEEIEPDKLEKPEKPNNIPEKGTKEWTDYIISHCYPNELKQGCPTCDGLRRLVEKFVGEIIFQGVTNCNTYLGELCSTVTYEVKIIPFAESEYLNINDLPVKTYREVADAHPKNTKDEFSVHPSATASTRAEGRCYRKALKLTVLTAEELENDKNPKEVIESIIGRREKEIEEYLSEHITSAQISMIEGKCRDLNINLFKLIQSEFGDQYIDINQLSRGDGTKLAVKINEFQQKKVPEELKNEQI